MQTTTNLSHISQTAGKGTNTIQIQQQGISEEMYMNLLQAYMKAQKQITRLSRQNARLQEQLKQIHQ